MELDLSESHLECLQWVSLGKSHDQIADIIGVSAAAVNKWLQIIYVKLGASNASGAVGLALRQGIIK